MSEMFVSPASTPLPLLSRSPRLTPYSSYSAGSIAQLSVATGASRSVYSRTDGVCPKCFFISILPFL